jgi:hypothetical protein
LGRELAVKQAEDAVLEQEQLATDGRTPTAMEGVFGLTFWTYVSPPIMAARCRARKDRSMGNYVRPKDSVRHGQVVWAAVDKDHRPGRYQRIAETDLVSVVLDVSTADDIHARIDRVGSRREFAGNVVTPSQS